MQDATKAALAALITLQAIMLASLYGGVAPHPPRAIPLFAIAPFLAASLSICAAAWILHGSRAGRLLSLLAAAAALISFGPQKYLDPAFPEIWPAVLAAQVAVLALVLQALPNRRAAPEGQPV